MILVDTVQRSHVYHVSYSRARGGRQAQEGRVDQSVRRARSTQPLRRPAAVHRMKFKLERNIIISIA